jgi:hypothetical protein
MSHNSNDLRRFSLLVSAAACAALMTGCAMSPIALSGPAVNPVAVSVNISGTVHGGQAPISGSLLQLYAVGNASYGSAATPLIPSGGVGSVTLNTGGSGYTSAPTVGFTGGGGTGATATASLSAGVTGLALTNGGTGYASAPTVTFTGGGGTGAAATATLGTGGTAGQVVSLTLTNAGSGYTSVPTIGFTGANTTPATATASTSNYVSAVTLTAAGTGYTSAPTVTFTGGAGTGAAATANAVPTAGVTTNSTGGFNITSDFTCPSSTSLVYLVATGGNPGQAGGTNNTAIALAAPLGQCGNLSAATTVSINELTTAAMAFAMGQYFTTTFGGSSTDSFGAPNTTQAQVGITNAYGTVANLVNVTTGAAVTTNTLTTAGVGTITVTPEASKLITIGNILAACVNTASSASAQCATLFSDVTPTGGTAPTDVLQAAVDMSLNPTSTNTNGSSANLTALYNLPNGNFAFSGGGTQPTDWTLGITYASNTKVASTSYLLYEPEHVSIDASGNVWLANFNGASTGNSVTELSPTGTPLLQTLTSIGGTSHSIAIDQTGNVWIPISYAGGVSGAGTTVYEYTTAGATNVFTTGNDPSAIAFDGVGNAFVLEPSFKNTATAGGTASTGTLEEIPAGSASTVVPTTIATNLLTDFSGLVVDKNYTLWVTGGGSVNPGTAAGGLQGIYQFLKNTGTGTGYPTTPSATGVGPAASPSTGQTAVSSLTTPETAVTVNNNGDILVANFGNSTIGGIAATSTTTLTNANNIPITTTSVTAPQLMAVDGANNLWVGQVNSAGTVYAYTPTGTPLAPAAGFARTYTDPYQIAIDPSGNVWVGSESTSTASKQAFVTEIVGAAVPVVTPIAAGLPTTAGGTSTLGTRP